MVGPGGGTVEGFSCELISPTAQSCEIDRGLVQSNNVCKPVLTF